MTRPSVAGDWVLIGRFWYNTKTRQVMPVIQGGALPATDTFTDADSTPLTTHSASWTYNTGASFLILSNSLNGGTSDKAAHWNADAFDNNQYAKGTIVAQTAGAYIGPAVRVAASATTCYQIYTDGTLYTQKWVDGSYTDLSIGTTTSVNDIIYIEANGTTITTKKNGTEVGHTTDETIASGSAGVFCYSSGSRLDDWEGGNLVTSTQVNVSDTAHGTDNAPTISVSVSRTETGSGTDSQSISASLGVSDSGSGTEGISKLLLTSVNDNGVGVDATNISALLGPIDTALGDDFLSLLASLSMPDSAVGIDNPAIASSLGITDGALGGDFLDLFASLNIAELAFGSEELTQSIYVITVDVGTGTDELFITSTVISGSAVWGQISGALETNIRTYANNWAGTGEISGSGDSEQICLASGQYMVSEVVQTGVNSVVLLQNEYGSGDTVLLQYRHGATEADCLSASWNTYSSTFTSLGYVQIRIESTL